VPGCQKLTNDRLNPVWHRMLCSCNHTASVGIKGINVVMVCCSGELVWPDGRRYCGMFADGQFDGVGIYNQPSDDLGVEISEGTWKCGQLHGQARVRLSAVYYHKCNLSEFLDEAYPAKTRRMGLPCGENFIILASTVFCMIHPCLR